MKAFLSGSIAVLISSAALFVASTALADGEACYVDTDCPGTACGDAVCNWNKSAPVPSGTKIFYCNPAGTDPVGADGWCQTDADCKCKGEGATCVAPHCSMTKAPGGGSGGASSGGGGAPATTAGAPATTAGAPAATAGATSTPPSSSDSGSSGGCSLSVPGKTSGGVAAALAMLGLGVAFRRRRR
jgi:MYXO-CTERM domain-containing protein